MTAIQRSATIQATPGAIWADLAEPSNWPEGDPDMISVDADGPGIRGLLGTTIQRLQGSTVARGVDDGLADIVAATGSRS